MGSRTRQLEEQDRELLKFHERIGDLWLKVPDLKEQLEIERADRKDIEEEYWDKVEALTEVRSQLSELQQNLATANHQLDEVTAERAQLEAQLAELQAQLATLTADRAASQAELRSQLAAERTARQQLQTELASTREELAKLKENPPPATAQNPAAEVKLPDAADLLNQLKKANGKKFTASLTDVEKILESLGVEES